MHEVINVTLQDVASDLGLSVRTGTLLGLEAVTMNTELRERLERAAQDGDKVNIDYEGTRDGVAFDGGSAQGSDLELGSGRMIEGFEDYVGLMIVSEQTDEINKQLINIIDHESKISSNCKIVKRIINIKPFFQSICKKL